MQVLEEYLQKKISFDVYLARVKEIGEEMDK